MNIQEIMRILPHRYPMLLVDRVLEIEEGKTITALKNVSVNESFFQGHFPGAPVMPGVLIIEAMAQCGAILCIKNFTDEERAAKLAYFGGIDKARFRKPVVPGDQLIMQVEILQRRPAMVKLRGEAKVNDVLVAEAEMMSLLGDRPR